MKRLRDLRSMISCLVPVAISIMSWSLGSVCSPAAEKPKPADEPAGRTPAYLKPLSDEQQKRLLDERLDGGMGNSFSQFSNMFLVMSRIKLPCGIGLMTPSREIAKTELQPIFPDFYRPTLREFLDVIALQTSSQWKYDPTSKYFKSDVESGPVEGLAMFEFTKIDREKPFQVTLPRGWKAVDKGNWMMYIPPVCPLGMDIHELGTYSSDDKTKGKDLLNRVPREVALEWAKRAKDEVDPKELKPAKVGSYDALSFETMMPLRDGSTVRWRHWVFMVENKCYCVISTIFPQYESRVFPDVQGMLASFTIKKAK